MATFWIVVFLGIFVLVAVGIANDQKGKEKLSKMSPSERGSHLEEEREAAASVAWGPRNFALACPHCEVQGKVRVKSLQVERGISGAKATGVVLTGGVSIFMTGLSKKEAVTQAHCDNCDSRWRL